MAKVEFDIPVTRVAAFNAISSERAYQDERWEATRSSNKPASISNPGGTRSLDEFILYIRGYAEDLANIGAHVSDPIEKLNFIRKVGGLCVAAMEQHGAPQR